MPLKNFSYTLLGHTDCYKKVEFFVNGVEPLVGGKVNLGTKMHKELELYAKDELYHPSNLDAQEKRIYGVMTPKIEEIRSDILHIEKRAEHFYVYQPPCTGFNIVGVMDLLTENRIIDYKFPEKPWTVQKYEGYKKQAYLYFWLHELYFGRRVETVEFWVCPTSSPREFFIWPVANDTEIVTNEQRKWVAEWIKMKACESSGIFPSSPGHQCRWCWWRKYCPDSITGDFAKGFKEAIEGEG